MKFLWGLLMVILNIKTEGQLCELSCQVVRALSDICLTSSMLLYILVREGRQDYTEYTYYTFCVPGTVFREQSSGNSVPGTVFREQCSGNR